MQNIRGKIDNILNEQLQLSETPKPEDTLKDDLGADSLDIVEILMVIEEEFNIEIPEKDVYAEKKGTVESIYKFVEGKCEKQTRK